MSTNKYRWILQASVKATTRLFGFVSACSLSFIIYDFYLYGVISVITILFTLPALVALIIAIIIDAYVENRNWKSSLSGLQVFCAIFVLITPTSIAYKIWRDSPAVLLHANFDGKSTTDLYLREDGTVKCEENHMLGVNESYGHYRINEDTLFLENVSIHYCNNKRVSTLIFEENDIRLLTEYEGCSIKNTKMDILLGGLNVSQGLLEVTHLTPK